MKERKEKREADKRGRTAVEADLTHLKVLTGEIVCRGPQWSERTTLGQLGSKTLNSSRLAAWGILPPSSHFCLRKKKKSFVLACRRPHFLLHHPAQFLLLRVCFWPRWLLSERFGGGGAERVQF